MPISDSLSMNEKMVYSLPYLIMFLHKIIIPKIGS